MDPELPDQATLLRAVALTTTGERLGLVVDVDYTPDSSESGWAWVRTGITASDLSLVPLSDARYANGSLVIPTTATAVESAPQHPAGTSLSPEHQSELGQHYALFPQPVQNHLAQEAIAATGASQDAPEPLRDSDGASTVLQGAAPDQPLKTQRPHVQTDRTPTSGALHQDVGAMTPKKDLLINGLETVLRQLNLLSKRLRR